MKYYTDADLLSENTKSFLDFYKLTINPLREQWSDSRGRKQSVIFLVLLYVAAIFGGHFLYFNTSPSGFAYHALVFSLWLLSIVVYFVLFMFFASIVMATSVWLTYRADLYFVKKYGDVNRRTPTPLSYTIGATCAFAMLSLLVACFMLMRYVMQILPPDLLSEVTQIHRDFSRHGGFSF